MSHPFVARMQAAILQVEARFMVQRGLQLPVSTVVDPIAQLTQRLKERALLSGMAAEGHILPAWRRKPQSFHTLASGEIVQLGPGRAHTVREQKTTYFRRQWSERDASYLQKCILASRPISADEANSILRTMKRSLPRPKRGPLEAAEIIDTTYCLRAERHLTGEQLAREQLSHNPKQLAKELARMKKQ